MYQRSTKEIVKCLELNNNECTTDPDLQNTGKEGKITCLNIYFRNKDCFKISDLYVYLKNLENDEQIKPKVRTVNKYKNRHQRNKKQIIKKNSKAKSWSFEKKLIQLIKSQQELINPQQE